MDCHTSAEAPLAYSVSTVVWKQSAPFGEDSTAPPDTPSGEASSDYSTPTLRMAEQRAPKLLTSTGIPCVDRRAGPVGGGDCLSAKAEEAAVPSATGEAQVSTSDSAAEAAPSTAG